MSFGVIAAFEGDGRGASQGLDTFGIAVPRTILAPFGQQPWSQALARTGQTGKDHLILMGQKKGTDLFVVGSNVSRRPATA